MNYMVKHLHKFGSQIVYNKSTVVQKVHHEGPSGRLNWWNNQCTSTSSEDS